MVISMRMRGWLALLMACWTLQACASLPPVDAAQTAQAVTSAPRIETAGGKVAPNATLALLQKRWTKGALDLTQLATLEEAATGVPLISGNKVQLLFDGPQSMQAMMTAIRAARNHINFETYIFDQDVLGEQFSALLLEKQRAGVTVNVMYDSVGTLDVPQEFFERLRAGGVHLVAFNPVNPARVRGNGWKVNQRDHRKILVVDGKVAFTGGINISDTYVTSSPFRSRSGSSGRASKPAASTAPAASAASAASYATVASPPAINPGAPAAPAAPGDPAQPGWRDTHVQIEGPAVAAFQWLFVRAWSAQDADDLPDADYFPRLQVAGDRIVRVLGSAPGGRFEIYQAYLLAMQEARRSIHITMAYFVPDRQTLTALMTAARRGVDVRIVLPGISDSSPVFHAGRACYEELLEAGVKIDELNQTVLHAKTAVIDGVWSAVGSTNLDNRSFLHNSEVSVIIMGAGFGGEMEKAFQEDLRHSTAMTLEQWRHRPWSMRVKEWSAEFWAYWL